MNSNVNLRFPFGVKLNPHCLQIKCLSSVNPHVDVKVSFLSETLSTLFTDKMSLSSVNLYVDFQVLFLNEIISTLLAGV